MTVEEIQDLILEEYPDPAGRTAVRVLMGRNWQAVASWHGVIHCLISWKSGQLCVLNTLVTRPELRPVYAVPAQDSGLDVYFKRWADRGGPLTVRRFSP